MGKNLADKYKLDNSSHKKSLFNRLRLFVVLDAMLSTNSVTKAASSLGMQKSDISKNLQQLREILQDELFVRSGRGLVPTPRAESLRSVVHKLSNNVDAILAEKNATEFRERLDVQWTAPADADIPQLAYRPSYLLQGEPAPWQLAAKYQDIGDESPPHSRLIKYSACLSHGAGQRRSLHRDEARDMLDLILQGEADPSQIGALLGIIGYRRATATEITGFVEALRAHVADSFGSIEGADLDWPCFTSPHVHRPPWYFHAARLVAAAGYRVFMHGGTGSGEANGRHEKILRDAGVAVAFDRETAQGALLSERLVYVPLTAVSAQIYRLLGLYRVLGGRNPVHDAVVLANPAKAHTSLLGAVRSSDQALHMDVARMLATGDVVLVASNRDAAEVNPFRIATLQCFISGAERNLVIPASRETKASEQHVHMTSLEFWNGIWTGAATDERAQQVIISTAAVALYALEKKPDASFEDALGKAKALWERRLT